MNSSDLNFEELSGKRREQINDARCLCVSFGDCRSAGGLLAFDIMSSASRYLARIELGVAALAACKATRRAHVGHVVQPQRWLSDAFIG